MPHVIKQDCFSWACAASAAFNATDPREKCQRVHELWRGVDGAGQVLARSKNRLAMSHPGRPEQPQLVSPTQVPRRRLGGIRGRFALVHAVAHIEFNAINLALDAALRFVDMPADYYYDWLSVAEDEARHFELLQQRLVAMDGQYGDLPAHNGLWEMAEATADDVMLRMALVPRVLEARGLDVTPGMIERLRAVNDEETVAALEVILREEVRHVAIGSRWFLWCCNQRGLEPDRTFIRLLEEHYQGQIAGPFNHQARDRAGFSSREMARLMDWDRARRHEN